MPTIARRTWLETVGTAVARTHRAQPGAGGFASKSPREVIRARHLPNVALRTHDNRAVRFYDDLVRDRIVVINFMYATCDGICPGITANLVRVHKLLADRVGRDIFMYSITLKPEQDTPAVLAKYAAMYRTGPGWWFLTGAPGDVEMLRRKLGFVSPDPQTDADESEHIGNIRYGNEARMLWAACPGLAEPDFIVESIGWVAGTFTGERP
jgi:protein SCO1/2